MPGTAIVVIGDNEWLVDVATTPQELLQGLAGVASIPAGTGMLFDLGAEQIITVTSEEMLFPVDVIFISSDLKVTEVAFNLMPGYFGTTSLPAQYFLEVNAGEAAEIFSGDDVSITITQAPGFDLSSWSSIINLALPLVLFAFLFMIIQWQPKSSGSSKGNPGPKELPLGYRPARPGEHLEVIGLVKVTDAETGELKRWEDGGGRLLAMMMKGRLTLTEYGRDQGYSVFGEKLVMEYKGGKS